MADTIFLFTFLSMPPPQTNSPSTPLYPNDSSMIQFVCCSSEGVSSVTIIMRNCVVGCFWNDHNHTFISSGWNLITDGGM